MRRLDGYEKAEVYTEQEKLPVGGYVLKILDVEYDIRDWGDRIILSFDIAEGEHTDFYKRNYHAQTGEDRRWKGVYRQMYVPKDDGSEKDGWTMRRFKTIIANFEASNNGYHWDWDEKSLKGKLIGGLFNNKEYQFNGRHGFFVQCHSLTSVDKIRNGDFKVPDDTLLKNATTASDDKDKIDVNTDFLNIPGSNIDEEIPFN